MRVTPARAPASTDQRCQTSFRGELVLAWPQNGVISPDLNLGCWEHMSSSMQATFRYRTGKSSQESTRTFPKPWTQLAVCIVDRMAMNYRVRPFSAAA